MSAVVVASVLDTTLREPAARWHPVVWMGSYLERAGRRLPSRPPNRARAVGGLAWGAGALGSIGIAVAAGRATRRLPRPVRSAATGAILWTLVSGRLLHDEVAAVESALSRGVGPARERLAHVVSRDTSRLDAVEIRASAIESLAENLSDSVVAPLFWYVLGGLPAATAYRFANTADAMWGYRTPRWVHAGTVAARVDDLLNVVPARLTAVLLLAVGRVPLSRWADVPAEAHRTASPNAGWPMAAVALALDVRLPKPGHYVLNSHGQPPEPGDATAARRLAARAAIVAALGAAVITAGGQYAQVYRTTRLRGGRS